MSDGGRGRASLGVEGWKSSQNVDAERSAVRSIAWLDGGGRQLLTNVLIVRTDKSYARMIPKTRMIFCCGIECEARVLSRSDVCP